MESKTSSESILKFDRPKRCNLLPSVLSHLAAAHSHPCPSLPRRKFQDFSRLLVRRLRRRKRFVDCGRFSSACATDKSRSKLTDKIISQLCEFGGTSSGNQLSSERDSFRSGRKLIFVQVCETPDVGNGDFF